MAANKNFKLRILAVFVFVLLAGLTTVALSQGETTETSETDQSRVTEENKYDSQTYYIILMNNVFSPETTEINQYDTVIWRNLNKPKRTFVLVSEDKLWEDFSLGYGRTFEYTFNETGTFAFSVEGEPNLKGTVVVGESRETAGAPLPEQETLPIEEEEETETEEEEEVIPAPTEEATPTPKTEQVQGTENSVLIRGSVFYPETLELKTGETLIWKNLNRPKQSFTLVSEEGLFDDQVIGYGKSFSYTFDKIGDYNFKLEEIPDSELIVIVN